MSHNTWFSKIFGDETISELLKDTEHELAKELSNFKKYCQSFTTKMNLIHDFTKQKNRASFDKMESEIRRINSLIRLELRLETKEGRFDKAAIGKIERVIQKETYPVVKAKLVELRQDLVTLLILIEKLKDILLGQLKFLDENKRDVSKASQELDDFVELTNAEYTLLARPEIAGQNEQSLLQKILKELMKIEAFRKKAVSRLGRVVFNSGVFPNSELNKGIITVTRYLYVAPTKDGAYLGLKKPRSGESVALLEIHYSNPLLFIDERRPIGKIGQEAMWVGRQLLLKKISEVEVTEHGLSYRHIICAALDNTERSLTKEEYLHLMQLWKEKYHESPRPDSMNEKEYEDFIDMIEDIKRSSE